MKRLFFLLFLFFPVIVLAQQVPYARNFGMRCPGGASICQPNIPRKIITFDFMTGTLPATLAFTRASAASYFDSSGLLASAGVNVPRFDYGIPGSTTLYGLNVEAAATNVLLYSRDLTQVTAWSPTNATVALNQTGIDGISNSASSITATSASATVCQTVTHASAIAVFSVYLKRISGSGVVSISQDGGSTYTTTSLSSSWQRFSHAEQSILNPGLCIKVSTSGDAIAVDVAQFEYSAGHGFATSPIITTSAPVARSADNLSVTPLPWYNRNAGAYIFQWRQNSFGQAVIDYVKFNNSGYGVGVNNGNLQIPNSSHNCLTPSVSVVNKGGATYTGPGGVFSGAVNNVTCAVSASIPVTNPTTLNFSWTWVQKFTYYNYSLTTAQLKAATQ